MYHFYFVDLHPIKYTMSINISEETKTRLVELLQSDIETHQAAINRIRLDILSIQNGSQAGGGSSPIKTNFVRMTVKQSVVEDLKDGGVPKTTRQLMESYISKTGRKTDITGFSGQVTPLKRENLIKTHTIPGNPQEKKYYQGLPEWFEGDNLKPEYLEHVE